MAIVTNGLTTPDATKGLTQQAYMNQYSFANEYLPDAMSEVVKIWDGGQSLTGFLESFAQEQGFASDLTYWAEEKKFRVYETGVTRATTTFTKTAHDIRVNDKIFVSDITGNKTEQGIVTAINANLNSFTAVSSENAAWAVGTTGLIVIPIGSEFKKGTNGKLETLQNRPTIYSNSPVIMKDMYKVDLSDVPRIAWIKAPDGKFFWYFSDEQRMQGKFLGDNELSLIRGKKSAASSGAAVAGYQGTEGLFQAIETRGSVAGGGIRSVGDMTAMVKHLDVTNGVSDNLILCSTEESIAIDDTLADLNKNYDAGKFYGSFDNGQKHIDLGFDGFNYGSYNFSKQTWKLLKDPETFAPTNFGTAQVINGMMMPLGRVSIANGETESLSGKTGSPIPYLTLMYKEMPGYSRKMETSFEGTGLPNVNSLGAPDYHAIHWRTERCLRSVGMLKWLMFKGA